MAIQEPVHGCHRPILVRHIVQVCPRALAHELTNELDRIVHVACVGLVTSIGVDHFASSPRWWTLSTTVGGHSPRPLVDSDLRAGPCKCPGLSTWGDR